MVFVKISTFQDAGHNLSRGPVMSFRPDHFYVLVYCLPIITYEYSKHISSKFLNGKYTLHEYNE